MSVEPTSAREIAADSPEAHPSFGSYVRGHFSATRSFTVYGLVLALIVAPILSLLRPEFRYVVFTLAGIGVAGFSLGMLYLLGRGFAFFVGKRRLVSNTNRSITAWGCYLLIVLLAMLAPFIAADAYFENGWLVTVVPTLQQAQTQISGRLARRQVAVADSSAEKQPNEPAPGGESTAKITAEKKEDGGGKTATQPTVADPFEARNEEMLPVKDEKSEEPPEDQTPKVSGDTTTSDVEESRRDDRTPAGISAVLAADDKEPPVTFGSTETPPSGREKRRKRSPLKDGVNIPKFHRTPTKLIAIGFHRRETPAKKHTKPPFRNGAPMHLKVLRERPEAKELRSHPEILVELDRQIGDTLRVRDLFTHRATLIPAAAIDTIKPVTSYRTAPFAHRMRYVVHEILRTARAPAGVVQSVDEEKVRISLGPEEGLTEGSELHVFRLSPGGLAKPKRLKLRVTFFEEKHTCAEIVAGREDLSPGDWVVATGKKDPKIAVFPFRLTFEGPARLLKHSKPVIQRQMRSMNVKRRRRLIEYYLKNGKLFADKMRAGLAAIEADHVNNEQTEQAVSAGLSVPLWDWTSNSAFMIGKMTQATHVVFGDIEPQQATARADSTLRLGVLDVARREIVKRLAFTVSVRQFDELKRWEP